MCGCITLRDKQRERVIVVAKCRVTTNRDHENDANNEALISWFSVIEEVAVNVKNRQSDSSDGAEESDDVEESRNE